MLACTIQSITRKSGRQVIIIELSHTQPWKIFIIECCLHLPGSLLRKQNRKKFLVTQFICFKLMFNLWWFLFFFSFYFLSVWLQNVWLEILIIGVNSNPIVYEDTSKTWESDPWSLAMNHQLHNSLFWSGLFFCVSLCLFYRIMVAS